MLKNFFRSLLNMTKTTATEDLKGTLHKVISGRIEKPHASASEASGSITSEGVDEKKKKVRAKKYAMCLAYQGKNYYGMQVS